MLAGRTVLDIERLVVGEGELWLGSPARFARKLTDRELEQLQYSAGHYVRLKDRYLGMGEGAQMLVR